MGSISVERPQSIIRTLTVVALAVVLSLSILPPRLARAAVTAPTYVRTVGAPGLADLYPSGLDVDANGNVYVADTGNDRIEKYAPGQATPTWVFGKRGGSFAEGGFSNPRDVAIAPNALYVADTDNIKVHVLNPITGAYIRTMSFTFKSPLGVSYGTDGKGNGRILVSDGNTGNINVFDLNDNLVMTVLPHLGAGSGTRDAATDSAGNIYAADYLHDQIAKYSPTGSFITAWGGKTAPTCQQVPRPYGVTVDASDHVYALASNGQTPVKVFNPDGSCVPGGSYGVRGTTDTTTSQPRRVAVGAGLSPKVYVADLWGIKILVYNADGTLSQRIGSWPFPAAGGLNEARSVAVSASHVFVANTINQRIDRFDLNGANPLAFGFRGSGETNSGFNWPQGVAVNPTTGNVWVADTRNNRLMEFSINGGSPLRTFGVRVGSGMQFNWPMALTFDNANNVYVADTSNHRIVSFDTTPTTPTQRWSYGTIGSGSTNLRSPWGISYDAAGNRLLVADTNNSRIVALTTSGSPVGVLSIPKGAGAGAISKPKGVAAAPDGSFWVADTGNNRIERYNANGTFAGNLLGGVRGSSNDQFNEPTAMFVRDGLVYVADAFNNRVQVFRP